MRPIVWLVVILFIVVGSVTVFYLWKPPNFSQREIYNPEKSLISEYPDYDFSNQEVNPELLSSLREPLQQYRCLAAINPCHFEGTLNPNNKLAFSVNIGKESDWSSLEPTSSIGYRTSASFNFINNQFVKDYLSQDQSNNDRVIASGLWMVVPTKTILYDDGAQFATFPVRMQQDLFFSILETLYKGMDDQSRIALLENIRGTTLKLVYYYSLANYYSANSVPGDDLYSGLKQNSSLSVENMSIIYALLRTFPANIVANLFSQAGVLDQRIQDVYGKYIDKEVVLFIDKKSINSSNLYSLSDHISICVDQKHFLCEVIEGRKDEMECSNWTTFDHLCNTKDRFLGIISKKDASEVN